MVPETEEDTQRNTSRDKSPNPKPGCSTSHYSSFVLIPIPNSARPMTVRKRNLQKSDILRSTPIEEVQKRNFEKIKVEKVTTRLNDKSTNVPIKAVPKITRLIIKKKTLKKLNSQINLRN